MAFQITHTHTSCFEIAIHLPTSSSNVLQTNNVVQIETIYHDIIPLEINSIQLVLHLLSRFYRKQWTPIFEVYVGSQRSCNPLVFNDLKYAPKLSLKISNTNQKKNRSHTIFISFRQQWDPLSNQFKDGTILIHDELSISNSQIQLSYKTKLTTVFY